jgi:NCAIR mutase (PurE)-related protein
VTDDGAHGLTVVVPADGAAARATAPTGCEDGGVEPEALHALLADVAAGRMPVEDAAAALARLPFADLGYARVDHHRTLRQGMPEAVYAPGKSPEQCAGIVAELLSHGTGPVLLTRADAAQRDAAIAANGGAHVRGRTVVWRPAPTTRPERVVVAVAGTADLPVAEECEAVLGALGLRPHVLSDVGVAGLHRLLPHIDDLARADAVVAVAGMEGALASVVGGLTAAPVVAVPTSVGYGASFAGVTALLAMLASCAQGVTVVGIDNGFGAACAVARLCGSRAARA